METAKQLINTPYSKETSTPINLITAAVLSAALTLTGCQDTNTNKTPDTKSSFQMDLYEDTNTGDTEKCIEKYGEDDCPKF